MKKHVLSLLAIAVSFLYFSLPAAASTPLFGTVGLDPAFCKQKVVRQTVVYVDDMMMVEGKVEWAKKINSKLKSTLLPGERVSVVRLSPAVGQSTEIWTGCWPGFSPEQQQQMAKETYFFTQNPMEGLNQQQAFFVRDFGSALTNIHSAGKRAEEDVRVDLKAPPRKHILRALASDESRFSNSTTTIRAIIYSDMLENSDLGSVFNPLPNPFPNFAEKLGSKFKKGVFYAFGVAEDMTDGQAAPSALKAYWTDTFKVMSAVLNGFGSDLNVPNSVPMNNYNYNLHYSFDGQELEGKMSLLTDADGNIMDSWIGFSRLTIAGVTGTFICTNDNCKLDGTTTTSIATTSPTESLAMSGKVQKLSGQLGVAGTKMSFELKADQLNN